MRITANLIASCLLAAALCPAPAQADIKLEKKTVDAYDLYVKLNQERIDAERASGKPFLWLETLPEGRRREVEKELNAGEVTVEHIRLNHEGKKVEIPDGMVHHWIGTVFIPGATVPQVLAMVQDYGKHASVYKPDVMESRILEHQGDNFKVFFRFLKKKVLTVVLDSDHQVQYQRLGPKLAMSRSWTTRIAEVEHPGKPDESLKPVGDDSGFMWRLDTWWRFEEREGGTFVQCETISLSRDIPFGLGWAVGPFVKSIPKESLAFTLGTTRSTLITRLAQLKNGTRPSPSN